MTASLVASVKVEREQIEQLARALRVELRVSETGAALFRRCLARVVELATGNEEPSAEAMDAIESFNARARVLLGGLGEAEATEAPERPPAPRRSN